MAPRVQICHCQSHGCADAEHKSTVTGQILKGRYLGDGEYRSHQRHERAKKHSSPGSSQVASTGPDLPPPPLSPPSSLRPSIFESESALHRATVSRAPLSDTSIASQPPSTYALSPDNPLEQTYPQRSLELVTTEALIPSLSVDGYSPLPIHPVTKSVSRPAQNPMEVRRLTGPTNQKDELAVAQGARIMQLIIDCRFDFHLWQRSDISCDGLAFEETAVLEPSSIPRLRVDILSNVQFIEYEETMLSLLDRIEKINTGADEQCRMAKHNVFSSIEDELHRLRGLKLHAWKVQVKSTTIALPAPQSGPFREIDTGTQLVECLIGSSNETLWHKSHISH